eukprot:SM000149S01358  [mRNA]  locus=s149:222954:224336:- [translate_table: standard]
MADVQGILGVLQHVRKKAKTDVQKRNEELMNNVKAHITGLIEDAIARSDGERLNFVKSTSRVCKEFEAKLRKEMEVLKLHCSTVEQEMKGRQRAQEELLNKLKDLKQKLQASYDHQRKREKEALARLEEDAMSRINEAHNSMQKAKEDVRSFDVLRKSIGTFMKENSDEDEEDESDDSDEEPLAEPDVFADEE